ncbi:hypothetical protein [Ferrimonas pelagia]|uniref:L-2-amino-thiazoline-4-carboxylic acid hydrolase n=1 Tax=Ferrimonas pelagia TaxID=1177826 RepID=A0ABP9F7K7_9GAMM
MNKYLFASVMHTNMRIADKFKPYSHVIRAGNKLLFWHLIRQYKKQGLEGWKKNWEPAFAEYGRHRSKHLVARMNIDANDAKSIGQYHDFEDPIFGVKGYWDTTENGEPVRVETACSACEQLMKATDDQQCRSDFCRHLVESMEQATGSAINSKYQVEAIALMTEGDETCQFVHRITNEAAEKAA